MRKNKKLYLGFFYGNQLETAKAFNKITDGGLIRYILTADTLICRFQSNKPIDEINELLLEFCSDVAFFIFPISNKNWKYNLPFEVENNLLTDKPIIRNARTQVIHDFLMRLAGQHDNKELSLTHPNNSDLTEMSIDDLNILMKKSISDDNFELAAQIRDQIKELNNQKTH